jgi:hypothetical protein
MMRILAALILSLAFSAPFAETRFLEEYAGRASDGDTFTLMLVPPALTHRNADNPTGELHAPTWFSSSKPALSTRTAIRRISIDATCAEFMC